MKTIRLFALLAVTGVAVATAPQDVTLRRTLKEGTSDVYTVNTKSKQNMDIPQMGEQDITLDTTLKLTFKYGKVDNGKADVELIMTDFKVSAGGALAAMMPDMSGMLPKEVKTTGKLDELGVISEMKTAGMGMQEMMVLGSQTLANSIAMVVFPKDAVKFGDTWTMPIPDNKTAGIQGATVEAKLVGEKQVDGIDCYEITTSGKFPMKLNMGDVMDSDAAGMMDGMVMTGTITMKGTNLVEKATGRLVKFDGGFKSNQTMSMGGQGDMQMSGDTTVTMKLAK